MTGEWRRGDRVSWIQNGEEHIGTIHGFYSGLKYGNDPFTGRPREDSEPGIDIIEDGKNYVSHRLSEEQLTRIA